MQTTERMGQTARVYRAENVLEKPSPRLLVQPELRPYPNTGGAPRRGRRSPADYDAFQAVWKHNRKALDDAREAGRKRCELWAGLVTSSDWWSDRGLPRRVKVGKMQRNARTSRGGWYADGWKIRLSEHGMTPYVVLHELAHIADMATAADQSRCDHTGTFTAWLLTLVELGLGHEAAVQLLASLLKEGALVDSALWERLQETLPEGHPAGGLWELEAHRITPAVALAPATTPTPERAPLAVAAKPTTRLEPVAGVQGSLW